MWSIYIIGFLTILSFVIYNTSKKKSSITSKFSILIHLLFKLDKNLVMENTDKNSLTLFSSNIRGTITIFFIQFCGIISIIIESSSLEDRNLIKEWIYLENMNPYLIFNQIINELQSFPSTCFDEQLLIKLVKKSNSAIQNTTLTNSYSLYNIAQSYFCIAFTGVKKLNTFQKTSQKGSFEVLFFNCMVTLTKSDCKEQNQLWNELAPLLIFYLENHNLMNQIKDVEKLLENRLNLYLEQIQQIKSNPDYNYNILYHYFFQKPLSLHSKTKLQIIQTSNLSKSIQNADFSKSIRLMIMDIEEKLPVLQNLMF